MTREEAAVITVDELSLLDSLADLLDVPAVERRGIGSSQADGLLWKLGTARLSNGFHYPVWLCRKSGTHLAKIDAALRQMSSRTRGLILTSHLGFPPYYQLPTGFYTLPIADAIDTYSQSTALNKVRLYEAVIYPGLKTEDRPVILN